MGLLKIFTRRSSKAKLKANDVHSCIEFSAEDARKTPHLEAEALVMSIASLRDLSPKTQDQSGQFEPWDSLPAPAPSIPRHPSLVEARPETAPSIRSLGRDWSHFTTRPKREPRKPPVSFRKPSLAASVSSTHQSTTYLGGHENGSHSLLGLRTTNGSRSSLVSFKSKDILDAQEEIRPTGFRTRLHATGARDYGEDVADRNITPHRDGTISPTPDPARMGNRTKSLTASSTFPRATAPFCLGQTLAFPLIGDPSPVSPQSASFSNRRKRGLSLNTYVPRGMLSPRSARSVVTSPDLITSVAPREFATPAAIPRPDTAARRKGLSPAANNFSRPRSPRNVHVAPTPGNISPPHKDHALDEKNTEAFLSDNVSSFDLSSYQRTSNQSAGHARLPMPLARQSCQTVRSSLASSVQSRYSSTDLTPLGCPTPRQPDSHMSIDEVDRMHGRAQSSYQHFTFNGAEDQISYHRTKSLGFMSSPLEADEQSPVRPGSIRNWSPSETSRSDTTAHSNTFSTASVRSLSRHTVNTSVDSKSAESFVTASNGQHGGEWSPVTIRSKHFNIDDYVSSDDDSFTDATRGPRPSAQGEEDLLFKAGYGITGAALPGLEALGDEVESPAGPARNNRNGSVSSNGTAAVASSPKDTRYRIDHESSPALRHVQSDPEDLYMSTFGRTLMRQRNRFSTAKIWTAQEEDEQSLTDLDGWYTPSVNSAYSDEHRSDADTKSTTGSLRGFRTQRSESSFSVYSTGGAAAGLITDEGEAADRDSYEEARAPRRGLERLSALGILYSRSTGSLGSSDRRPATASGSGAGEEMSAADIIRRRKEDKTRKRADNGLRSIREKRLTQAFGRPDSSGMAALRERLEDDIMMMCGEHGR